MFRRVITIFHDRFGVGASPAPAAANAAAVTGTTGTTSSSTTDTGTNPADLSALAAPVAALEGTLARVEQHAQQQITSKAQTGTDVRQIAPRRAELFGHLRSTAGVATTLKSQVPGIGVLKAPAPGTRADTLVSEAQAFAENAQIYAQVLIEHGRPSDFVAQLTAATTAYKDAIALKGASRLTQRGATAGLKSEIALGRQIVKQLDANLQQALRNSPADLAAWKNAKRVTKSSGGGPASVAPLTTAAAAGTETGTTAAPAVAGGQTPPVVSTTSTVASQTAPMTTPIAHVASAT